MDAGRRAELAGPLEAALAEARAAWPGVALDGERFVRHLLERLPEGGGAGALAALNVRDLYLACACAQGDPAALDLFERRVLRGLDRTLSRFAGAVSADEVVQQLRVKLFVPGAGPRKIDGYGGRGTLEAWVRIVATRLALDLVAGQPQHAPEEAAAEPLLAIADAEAGFLRSRYRREFEDAFRLALATLTVRERNVLRLYYVDGLQLAPIARSHRVHEATVSRWLLAARERLFHTTRRALAERMGVPPAEVESLLGQLLSQVELSLRTLLTAPACSRSRRP